uniref:Autophagy protein 5 n=1 Tax=Zooxanthella nutricula TaxID=1333877 RepID=A0A7S2QCZ1_9DINO
MASLTEFDVQRRMCGGRVLLRVRLSCDEIAWVTEPCPLFVLAPRLAYLPFFFHEVFEHFKAFVPPLIGQSYELWFDYAGVPLRWHYPIGVLVDVLVGTEVPTPLDLTVHFRGGPAKEVLPFSGIGDLKNAVMSAIRQAVFLQHGSATPWSKLPMQQQQRLWDAIKTADLEGCCAIRRSLLCESLSRCKGLPVRVHLGGAAAKHTVLLHPAPAFQSDDAGGALVSVGGFLSSVLPPLVDERAGHFSVVEGVEVIAHGIHIPLETPLYWIALHASYLDQFVHLVVRLPSANPTPLSPTCDAGGGLGT